MEEYTRDSLRAYRRELQQGKKEHNRRKGSKWITLLIVLLFLAAGAFYLQTEHSDWLRDFFASEVFEPWRGGADAAESVHKTVDGVLAQQNEAA